MKYTLVAWNWMPIYKPQVVQGAIWSAVKWFIGLEI